MRTLGYSFSQGECVSAVVNRGQRKGKKVRMPNKVFSSLAQGPLWIITCYRNNRLEVLTIEPDGDGGSFLALFSFEEEAQTFLGLLEDEEKKKKGWSIRQTSPGELISVL